MAVVRVQATTAVNVTGNTVQATLTGVAAGSLLTVGAIQFGSSTTTATCSDGTSYAASQRGVDTTDNSSCYVFYLKNAGAGSHTVTVTWSTSIAAGNSVIWFTEWSGVDTTSPFDIDAASTTPGAASTTINTPSITPPSTADLLYCVAAGGGTISAVNSPWTQGTIVSGDADGYILSGTTSPTAVNMTQTSGKWSAVAIAFKATTGSQTVGEMVASTQYGQIQPFSLRTQIVDY
jgi:hypothetical protein